MIIEKGNKIDERKEGKKEKRILATNRLIIDDQVGNCLSSFEYVFSCCLIDIIIYDYESYDDNFVI